jgi:hypothetical protein
MKNILILFILSLLSGCAMFASNPAKTTFPVAPAILLEDDEPLVPIVVPTTKPIEPAKTIPVPVTVTPTTKEIKPIAKPIMATPKNTTSATQTLKDKLKANADKAKAQESK